MPRNRAAAALLAKVEEYGAANPASQANNVTAWKRREGIRLPGGRLAGHHAGRRGVWQFWRSVRAAAFIGDGGMDMGEDDHRSRWRTIERLCERRKSESGGLAGL